MLGWATLALVSRRECYRGVTENSVYVAPEARGRGVGRALLEELCRRADAAGIWTIQAHMFADNAVSRALHEACGFRLVGTRERLARKHGVWRDTRARAPRVDWSDRASGAGGRFAARARGQLSSRSASSAAQRESPGGSSCVCGSSFRFLPHTRAEPGAVRAAEDLLRQRERDRVARPRREVERLPVTYSVRSSLVVGRLVLVLAGADRQLEDGVAEAAVAGPVEAGREARA